MQTETLPTESAVEISNGFDPTEEQLVNKVGELWKVHVQASSAVSKTREGLKRIRIHLGRRLYELKGVISRPGRGQGAKLPP